MEDLIFLLIFGSIAWIVFRLAAKLPIIPFQKKQTKKQTISNGKKALGNQKKAINTIEIDQEPNLMEDLLSSVVDIKDNMLHLTDNRFVMYCEVDPVNYFLKSNSEQETIDVAFETWLATLDYQVIWYLQNRFIDLSHPIENMRKELRNTEDLHPNALSYGDSLIKELEQWQNYSPRFETKAYIIFQYQVKTSSITADTEDELQEKITEKAKQEIIRRINTAASSLRKAEIGLKVLDSEGILDIFYHALNRRTAAGLKLKNLKESENFSLYSTADQDQIRVQLVKEMTEHEIAEKENSAKIENAS
ncbi:hypothetical protein LCY76_23425 [Fictibacillus sp. KIGAM418]|uniref:Uncharacterized protein n=1 Tax=Fictibacillus marinisediminis TaxID=2878389 RepID=A0A9X2BFA2_9BACL|nr:hypothetical protein [Fictibacillus marinisediminis]MCK6259526.1 hypothetical protein [Fictibacillus marinisediminis]